MSKLTVLVAIALLCLCFLPAAAKANKLSADFDDMSQNVTGSFQFSNGITVNFVVEGFSGCNSPGVGDCLNSLSIADITFAPEMSSDHASEPLTPGHLLLSLGLIGPHRDKKMDRDDSSNGSAGDSDNSQGNSDPPASSSSSTGSSGTGSIPSSVNLQPTATPNVTTVPEPATISLIAAGLGGLFFKRRSLSNTR